MKIWLEYDPARKTHRAGAQNNTKGGVVRFADVLNQLDLNWYFYGMTAAEMVAFLPEEEFARFRAPA